ACLIARSNATQRSGVTVDLRTSWPGPLAGDADATIEAPDGSGSYPERVFFNAFEAVVWGNIFFPPPAPLAPNKLLHFCRGPLQDMRVPRFCPVYHFDPVTGQMVADCPNIDPAGPCASTIPTFRLRRCGEYDRPSGAFNLCRNAVQDPYPEQYNRWSITTFLQDPEGDDPFH